MLVSVSNLRINNKTVFGTVKITEPNPIFNWEYSLVERALVSANSSSAGLVTGTTTAPGAGYEIRISSSNVNQGTNSFYGNMVATGLVASDRLVWRYHGARLSRGSTYYGQIRITDAYSNQSSWASFQFQYNSLPSVSSLSLTPSEPSIDDSLMLSYVFSDADGDTESGSIIWWFRNGIHEIQHDNKSIIDSEFLVFGDEWSAQVFPNDGYELGTVGVSSSVTITKTAPVASNLRIEPANPSSVDPLYALYDFSGPVDKSIIRWFVNDALQTANKKLARLNVEPGDIVRFEVKASDGEASSLGFLASPDVTITKAPLRVINILIDSEREPLELGNLKPNISWSVKSPDRQHNKVSVRVGTAPGAFNVFNQEILLGTTNWNVPDGLLQNGLDYYVSVAAGDDDGYGEYETTHFRTSGSRWHLAANNATGWTVETTVRVSASSDRPSSSSSSSATVSNIDSSYYQGIRIYDGSKFAEIRFYENSLIVISDTTNEVLLDLTNFNVVTITGMGSDIKVYVNYKLVFDGTGLLTASSSDKTLEFGAVGYSEFTIGEFINFYYTCDGAYEPSTSERYYDVQYQKFFETDGSIDFVTGVPGGDGYYSVSSTADGENSAIYKISDYIRPTTLTPARVDAFGVNRIVQDPSNLNTYVCHDAGITGMKSYVIPEYDSALSFTAGDTPEQDGYQRISTNATPQYTVSGLTINTTTANGKLFFTQNLPGNKWFDEVDNNTGWTISFSISVPASPLDDFSATNNDGPDGAGIYVNDGTFWENVYFFPQEVVFMGRRLSIPFDTTTSKDYVLVGKNENIKLFAKAYLQNTYTLVAESKLVNRATMEANAQRPSVAEFNGVSYATWHDDGGTYNKIYFSSLDNSTIKWSTPRLIVNEPYGATNPNIAIDSHGTVYIAYESHRADGTDIGFVVRNKYGWSNPFIISSDPKDALNPKISIDDDDNVHAVWEDFRNNVPSILYSKRDYLTGKWSTPLVITDGIHRCTQPAIDTDGSDIFVTYTKLSSIYLSKFDGVSWTEKLVSSSSVAANFSDLIVNNDTVYVVWHDVFNADFEIYSRRLNATTLNYIGANDRLTGNTLGCRFPVLGLHTGVDINENNIYCVFEGASVSDPYNVNFGNDTSIGIAYFNYGSSVWHSSQQSSGFDVIVVPGDTRWSLRPTLSKRFAGSAHILYECEFSGSDEYISNADAFSTVRDVVYDLSYTSTYDASSSGKDFRVSAQLPRREIRFGDFSDYRNNSVTFGYFRFYTKNAVEPFEMWLLPSETTAQDAVPNQNGDAWLAFADRLTFYFRSTNELAATVPEIDQPLRIRFDGTNKIYILNNPVDSEIFVSSDHVNFSSWGTGSNIKDFDFTPDGHMWVVTKTHVIEYNADTKAVLSQFPLVSEFEITCLATDDDGTVWVGTNGGLFSIYKGQITDFNSRNSGLLNDNVRDIAIRNSGTRYIATSGGIVKMIGSNFNKLQITDPDWADDISSVSWKEPNIIWAGGVSKLYQVIVDETNDSYKIVNFNTQAFANYTVNTACSDVIDYTLPQAVTDGSFVQLIVNGRVVKHGYRVKGNKLRLDAPLNSNDEVEILVRNDITAYATLEQNLAERLHDGVVDRHLKKFIVDNERIYGAVEGDKNQVVVYNQGDTYTLPYDKIVLDDIAPTGFLVFEKQLNSRLVQLFIDEAQDNLSGVADMVVSNYPNLTTDGTTPATWQPFKERFAFDIGTDFGNQITELTLNEYTGSGRRLGVFNNNVYAGTASPATLYRLDTTSTTASFAQVFDFPDEPADTSVEFILPYQQTLIVGTGSPSGQAKLWTSTDGINFSILQVLSGTHALCGTILSGTFYVGTKGGPLYKLNYTGLANNPIRVESTGLTLGSAIYSIYGFADFLWIGTAGRAYKVNTDVNSLNSNQNAFTSQFLYADNDTSISAIIAGNFHPVTASTTEPPDDLLVFAASGTNGRIAKSINGNPFGPSLQTISTPITQLKFNQDSVLHTCVGRNLYKYSSNRSWEPVVTHTEQIYDVAFDQNGVWLIGETGVRRVTFEQAKKKIYFALRDVAGNATSVPGQTVAVADFEEINIADLQGFVNQNRILELDEYGIEVSRYSGTGDSPFYSANKVEVERAEYYSEIFNGTTDHVSWDIIYWDAYVPEGTDFKVQVRSATTQDGVLTANFTKTFGKEEFEGGDISSLSGQYLQFKVIMTSEVRGKSPKLYRVNVRALTRSSVHFFTTNFILPSKLNKIIVTADTIIPVAADIVVGIDTNDSRDFSTYQPIQLNRLQSIDPSQTGNNLRIGIKLISPLQVVNQVSAVDEYDEYSNPQMNNVVEFTYTAPSSGVYNFEIDFFNDVGLTDLATTLSTDENPTAWSVNGAMFPTNGIALSTGNTVKVLAAVKGNAAIRCNQHYHLSILASRNDAAWAEIESSLLFISGCNPSCIDIIDFPFTNTGATSVFHFRIKVFSDVTRTNLITTFYSGLDQSGWTVDGGNIPTPGYTITGGHTANVSYMVTGLDAGVYYLSIDYYSSGSFYSISNSYSVRVTNIDDTYCGEYFNVPIVKDLVAMFEIDDYLEAFGTSEKLRRTVSLNRYS